MSEATEAAQQPPETEFKTRQPNESLFSYAGRIINTYGELLVVQKGRFQKREGELLIRYGILRATRFVPASSGAVYLSLQHHYLEPEDRTTIGLAITPISDYLHPEIRQSRAEVKKRFVFTKQEMRYDGKLNPELEPAAEHYLATIAGAFTSELAAPNPGMRFPKLLTENPFGDRETVNFVEEPGVLEILRHAA